MVIGLLKRVIGGVVGAFSGGGNKSQTTETKPSTVYIKKPIDL